MGIRVKDKKRQHGRHSMKDKGKGENDKKTGKENGLKNSQGDTN